MTAENPTVEDIETIALNLHREGEHGKAETLYNFAYRYKALVRAAKPFAHLAFLIVRIKPTTIDKVVSLMNKLKKYDIVESVERHNDEAVFLSCLCGEPATINGAWCAACFPDTH